MRARSTVRRPFAGSPEVQELEVHDIERLTLTVDDDSARLVIIGSSKRIEIDIGIYHDRLLASLEKDTTTT